MMQAPPISAPGVPNLPNVTISSIGNTPIYMLGNLPQKLMRFDLVFDAGKWAEQQRGAAYFTSKLLKEGTAYQSAEDIALWLDHQGASITIDADADHITLTAWCLARHIPGMADLLAEIAGQPSFPNEEVTLKKKVRLQTLKVDEQKVEFLATKDLMASVFGNSHPYGYRMEAADMEAITQATLVSHYKNHIHSVPSWVFLSGHVDDNTISLLKEKWAGTMGVREKTITTLHKVEPFTPGARHRVLEGAQQTAIRIGRQLVTHNHPDYYGMKVLNTILGGYFGSRLMRNIREEKGYTYGIYSVVHSYQHEGVFYISTEVGNNYAEATMKEIRFELDKLQSEPVGAEELALVRNYLLGNMLGSLDGPLKAMDVYRNLITSGRDTTGFDRYIQTVKTITPAELQLLAVRYLTFDDMAVITVGP